MSALLVLACSGSDSADPDADVIVDAQLPNDAALPDAGPADAFDPCPGATVFEVGVVDWTAGTNLPGVLVQQVNTANTASSAPNGRVVLCVGGSGAFETSFSKTDYAERIHTTTVEATADLYALGQAPSFRLITSSDLDGLYVEQSLAQSDTDTTFIVMVTDATTGMPLSGATVSIAAANQGAFTPNGAGLTAGEVTGADGKVVFLNAARGAGTTVVAVTGPTSCEIPATAAVAGEVSSVAIACQP